MRATKLTRVKGVHDATAWDAPTGESSIARGRSMDRDPLIARQKSQTISSASPTKVKVLMVKV